GRSNGDDLNGQSLTISVAAMLLAGCSPDAAGCPAGAGRDSHTCNDWVTGCAARDLQVILLRAPPSASQLDRIFGSDTHCSHQGSGRGGHAADRLVASNSRTEALGPHGP